MPEPVCLAYCTCPDEESAERIADALVQEHVAACVSIIPGVRSVYRWGDELTRDDELLMLIKTTAARLADLTAWINALHPYEVPELIVQPITDGLEPYLDWVRTCTKTESR
jgi:periplasmic divalent cation tolerance protein